jgi:hypothetical protein
MTKAALRKQFGIPGGPGGVANKKKVEFVPPGTPLVKPGPYDAQNVEDLNRAALGEEEEPVFVPKKKARVLPQDPKFPGKKTLVPVDASTQGKRRAPSSVRTVPTTDTDFGIIGPEAIRATEFFASKKGSKEKFVDDAPVDRMVGKKVNPITLKDVETAERFTSEAGMEFGEIDEESFEETPAEKKRYEDAENTFKKSLEYSKRMRSTFNEEMADLNAQLQGIDFEQDAMEMCDTSFFDNDQANYYNDYADNLEKKKKKLEEEIERLESGQMKKKTGTKRVSSTRSKPRAKTRRVAVKRGPVKARRRKSTSSGRRSPGSPARSR